MENDQKPSERVVRAAYLERRFAQFNVELAPKLALWLSEYHKRFVVPLEERVELLEQPWYARLVNWVSARLPKRTPPSDLPEPPA